MKISKQNLLNISFIYFLFLSFFILLGNLHLKSILLKNFLFSTILFFVFLLMIRVKKNFKKLSLYLSSTIFFILTLFLLNNNYFSINYFPELYLVFIIFLIVMIHPTGIFYKQIAKDIFALFIIYCFFSLLIKSSNIISNLNNIIPKALSQYQLNFSLLNLNIILFFIIFILIFSKSKIYYTLLKLIGIFLIGIICSVFLLKFLYINAIYFPAKLIFFTILFLVSIPLVSINKPKTEIKTKKISPVYYILLFLLFFSSFYLLFPLKKHTSSEDVKIGIYSKGFFNLNKYEHELYGKDATTGARFGMLPEYLNFLSYEVTIFDTIPEISNKKYDILIFISIQEVFKHDDLFQIYDFIEKGGSMLVLGDHTNIGETQQPLNTLLSLTDISYKFDSAIPFSEGWTWKDRLDFYNFPVHKNLSLSSNCGLSVGASLDIGKDSYPFIISKYGFSDAGNINNKQGAYLGNMRYNRFEIFSDINLAAWTFHKNGKILVFGDTSTFQNFSILSQMYFINDMMQFLIQKESNRKTLKLYISLILFLIGIFIFINKTKINHHSVRLATLCIFLPFIIIQIYNQKSNKINYNYEDFKICYLDNSHFNLISNKHDSNRFIDGLHKNCIRNGFLPVYSNKNLEIRPGDGNFLFIIAPQKSYSYDELYEISKFVEQGGTVVFSTGFEEKEKSKSFLEYFKIEIGDLPLGACHTAKTYENKWKLKMYEAWPLTNKNKNSLTLCSAWDYPVISMTEFGKGELIIIADSNFLLGKNIETKDGFVLENIKFLKDVFENNIR